MTKPKHHLSMLLVSLSIFVFSVSADTVFQSINFGATTSYIDDNTIVWHTDDFMKDGESFDVEISRSVTNIPYLNTLRAFSNDKNKNCIYVDATKGQRFLVRTTFYYANYDGKSSPPTFDLQFDGNYWATVETSITNYIYYEVIYVTKWDYVSVCVAQTKPGHIPFITALEFRSMDSNMYSHADPNYPLFWIQRVAYATSDIIRYPDDPYDRQWEPAQVDNGLAEISTDSLVNEQPDNPPTVIMQNAITTLQSTQGFSILGDFLVSDGGGAAYMNVYFSEVSDINSNDSRSFQIFIDDQPLLRSPVIPPMEVSATNFNISSNTTFSLRPTTGSTLPPLINAFELLQIGDELTNGTDVRDLKGLASLQKAFTILQDWSFEEPCLPATYTWDWINCSSDSTPRVTALYLTSFDLLGELPDFSSMDALETIDFRNNSLDGAIPDFLATLPNLKELNLANNRFSGPIPDALSKKNGLKLVVTGNADLCASGKSCKIKTTSSKGGGNSTMNKKNNLPVILGVTIPIFIILWAVAGFFFIMRHKRTTSSVANAAGNPNVTPLASPMNDAQVLVHNMFKTGKSDDYNVELSDQGNQHENHEK